MNIKHLSCLFMGPNYFISSVSKLPAGYEVFEFRQIHNICVVLHKHWQIRIVRKKYQKIIPYPVSAHYIGNLFYFRQFNKTNRILFIGLSGVNETL